MKITELHVEGFRSFKSVTWKPGDLNVVIGPNGSGKSNLLQLLQLLPASARKGLSGHILRSGGMGAVVWNNESKEIALCLKTSSTELEKFEEKARYEYRFVLSRMGSMSSFRFEKEQLVGHLDVDTAASERPNMMIDRSGDAVQIGNETVSLKDFGGGFRPDESLLSEFMRRDENAALIIPFRESLASWSINYDFRTHSDSTIRTPVVTAYEKQINPGGENLIGVLHTLYTGNREFKEEIDTGMSAAFGSEYDGLEFPPAASQRIQLELKWKSLSSPQPAASLSDGTLRFLYLLTILANPESGPVIAIDEPETGLHPSMFPIIAEYAADAAMRSQVILTTHSPEFLDAFDHNDHDPFPSVTICNWEDGETVLRGVDRETLNRWLPKYRLGDMFKFGDLEALGS
jgi:predicted ATPase